MSFLNRFFPAWSKQTSHKRRKVNRLLGQLESLETRNLLANVLTYHNDAGKTGQNLDETILTRSNVNVNTFGKVFSVAVDGDIYAQPLVMEDVTIAGAKHDVVFVATQHGSLYAIDGKERTGSGQGIVLWKRSLLTTGLPGATAVEPIKRSDVGAGYFETVTTGTPVIDAATNTMYVLSKTRETVDGQYHFVQRIHAIDITDGSTRTPSTIIGDTVFLGGTNYINNSDAWVHGTGDGNDGDGHVYFNAMREHTRTALTLFNGVVYAGWASHESIGPYHGWVLGFDKTDLDLKAVFCTTPNGGLGGIWQAGGGMASDGTALYFQTGNGSFDGNNGDLVTPQETGSVTGLNANGFPARGNYGNSMLKVVPDPSTSENDQNINGWGLKVVDYFTPFNQKFLEERDLDLGSGAPVLLPPEVGSAAHPNLIVGSGKQGKMYLVDRDDMGKFGTKDNSVQTIDGQLSGSFDTPAYYKGTIYFVEGFGGTAKTFSIENGVMSSTPTSRSPDSYSYAGSTPSISADGNANGIVWDVDRGTNQLRAYSSDSYATQLYHSGQAAGNRDLMGSAATFQVPTVVNGHVYLGTASQASSTLVAYGLIQPPTARPAAPSNLRSLTVTGSQAQLTWQANDESPNVATGYLLQKSVDGGDTWTLVSSGVATTFTVGGLQKSTSYKFRVAATNSIGSSGFSNELTVTTTAAAVGFDFSEGFTETAGNVLSLNGAPINGGALVLTDGTASQFRNVFTKVMQDITKFTTTFDFLISEGQTSHGFTFVVQSDTPNAPTTNTGANIGEGLAYGSVQNLVYPHSLAIKFDLFRSLDQYENSGDYISTTGLYTNGTAPTSPEIDLIPSGIDLHSGHRMTATIDYDFASKTLTLTMTDAATEAQFLKVFNDIDLPQLVGGGAAYVGFTAATSSKAVRAPTQRILNWKFAPEGPPSPPVNLRTEILGQTPGILNAPPLGVEITWPDVPGATGYVLERRFGLVGSYDVVATLGGDVNSYADNSVGTQANYFYRLKATNAAGESAYSAEVVASTPGRVPTPRFGQTTSVTSTAIAMKWVDNATNEDGFHIRRRSGASDYTLVGVLPPNPGTGEMTFVDAGLQPNTNYDYHIEAFNRVGYSDYSGVNTDTVPLSGAPRAFFDYLASPRNTVADKIYLRFSKPVTGFTKADLTLTRNGNEVSLATAKTLKIGDRTISIDLGSLTGDSGLYKLMLKAAGAGIKDTGSHALTQDAELSWKKDSAAPSVVSFKQVTPVPSVHLTKASTVVYSLEFSEPVSAVSVRPTFSFGLSAQSLMITTTDNVTFTIKIGGLSGEGTLKLDLNDATTAIRDIAGNPLPPDALPEPLSIVVDRAAPVINVRTVKLEAGSIDPILSNNLLASDGRAGLSNLVYTVREVPVHVKLRLAGKQLQVNDKFTQLDVNTGNVTFRHDNSAGTTDQFKFTVMDGLNMSSIKTLKFSIIPFNEPPTIPLVPAQQTTAQTPLIVQGLKVTDPDAGSSLLRVTITATFGNVSLASTTGINFADGTGGQGTRLVFTGTLFNINRAINGLRFMPFPAFTGNAQIEVFVSDQGNGGTRMSKAIRRQVAVSVLPNNSSATTLNLPGSNANDKMAINVTPTSIDMVLGSSTYHYPRGNVNTLNVYGYAGDDEITINGTQGLVVNVFGGDGDDEVTVAAAVNSKAVLIGNEGNDILRGGSGADVLSGGGGNDRLVGGGGSADRYVFGNAGATPETDTIVELAGGGIDALDFATVNTAVTVDLRSDTSLIVQAGRKVVTGEAGQAAQVEGIIGGKGNDILRGNSANNFIVGNGGNDMLIGFYGNDTLVGGVGFDSLTGGNGDDKMFGGNGNDSYIFAFVAGTNAETDTITELNGEGDDTLDFRGVPTEVTTNLNGDPLATHARRKVVRGSAAELEEVLRSP